MDKIEKVNLDVEMKEAIELASMDEFEQRKNSNRIKNNTFLNIYKYIDFPELIHSMFPVDDESALDMDNPIYPEQTISNFFDYQDECLQVNNDMIEIGVNYDIDFHSEIEPRRIDIIHILALKYEDYFKHSELNDIQSCIDLGVILYA